MDNCRLHYTEQVENKIKEAFGVNRTSAKELPGKTILLTTNTDNPKLKTKDNLFKWAQRVVDSLNKRFRTDVYGNMLTIDSERYPKAILIKYAVPSKLIDYYIDKSTKGELKKPENISLNKQKTLSLEKQPEEIVYEHWDEIKILLDDDTLSLEDFNNFIEHLKNCK